MIRTIFDKILRQVWKDVKCQLPDAVTAETIAFGVGVIVGSVGKAATKGKFTILGVLLEVIKQIVIRTGLNVLPEAIKLTANEYAKLAEEIDGKLRDVGAVITDGDVRKIVEEISKHPREIKDALDKLQTAFE